MFLKFLLCTSFLVGLASMSRVGAAEHKQSIGNVNVAHGCTNSKMGKQEEAFMSKKRQEIAQNDQWNVEALYPSFKEWEVDLKKWGREGSQTKWPEIGAFQRRIEEGSDVLCDLIVIVLQFERELEKLYIYAHLRHDVDVSEEVPKQAQSRITALLHDFKKETAWIEPELLNLSEEKIESYLKSENLEPYKLHLEKIVRLKPYTLSDKEEALLALSGNATSSASMAFGSFNNADLKFPDIEDSKGKKHPLTHATYNRYIRSQDRTLRKNAFFALHESFEKWENTLCELINGQVQKHLFNMRARKYDSCVDAALFPNQIDSDVYISLIEHARENVSSVHRYMKLRKKLLGVDELHLYDTYVPLVTKKEETLPYPEAIDQVITSVAPLGEEYQKDLASGLKEGRWVDWYENEGKRSGAYSSGCYDSMPYILMNYEGTFRDLTTLAHEAGHSMHSFLSNKHQPYHYSHYPIFLAEVASTFNEELILDYRLSIAKDKEEKAYLLNQRIDDIRGTFFRQVMFAEFEFMIHEWAEKGIPLTPGLLKEEYRKLNKVYFGSDVVLDEVIDIEWARIPHFYYNFYVYQYATGISAAFALFEKVKQEGEPARQQYLELLSSGSSQSPLDLLKLAGVDMRKPAPILALIRRFDDLVKQLEELVDGN